jgi:hypothetical protein
MSKDDLIYELIFGEKDEFLIDIGNYMENIYEYDEFIDDIKKILKMSRVKIVSNSVDVNSRSVTWKLKLKK